MLPPCLKSSYAQYKADTDYVATFLASAVKQCESGPPKLSKSARRKAKKRAKATGNADSATTTTTTTTPNATSGDTQPSSYVIPIKDFIPLARQVAAAIPAVSIPRRFAFSLWRAITLRKGIQPLFKHAKSSDALSMPVDHDSGNDGHQHFVVILETVLEIIRPLMAGEDRKLFSDAQPEDDISNQSPPQNLFRHLSLEEPSDEFMNAPEIERDQSTHPTSSHSVIDYRAERQSDYSEAMVAITCCHCDLKELRATIWKSWSVWKSSDHAFLQITAMVSNAALEFARHLDEDIGPLLSAHGVSELIYLLDISPEKHSHGLHEQDGAERTLQPIHRILREYVNQKGPTLDGLSSLEGDGKTAGSLVFDTSQMSTEQRFNQNRTFLHRLLPQFEALHAIWDTVPSHTALDEVTRALFHVIETGRIPLWAAFAVLIYVDLHYILGEETRTAFDLFSFTIGVEVIPMAQWAVYVSSPPATVPSWIFRHYRNNSWLADAVRKETMDDPVAEYLKSESSIAAMEPHHLLKTHPILCGLKQYFYKYHFHTASIQVANDNQHILAAAHLYGALRREGLIKQEWDDMCALFHLQQPKIYVDWHRPRNRPPEEYFKCWLLAIGMSVTSLSRGRRPQIRPLPSGSAKGATVALRPAPVFSRFADRYVVPGRIPNMSVELIESILDGSQLNGFLSSSTSSTFPPRIPPAQANSRHRQRLELKGVSLTRALTLLTMSLQLEDPVFSANYFRMDNECFQFLLALKDDLAVHSPCVNYLRSSNSSLAILPGLIFESMVENRGLIRQLFGEDRVCQGPAFAPSKKLLEKAADTFHRVFSEKLSLTRVGDELALLYHMMPEIGLLRLANSEDRPVAYWGRGVREKGVTLDDIIGEMPAGCPSRGSQG